MSSPLPIERLQHIRDEALYLLECRPLFATQQALQNDKHISRAVVRSLEIIGEATKNLPADWRSTYPAVAWREVARMRDKPTHHYFDIDFAFVWSVLHEELDTLLATVEQMIRDLAPGGPA